jgi:nucleoid DNA-binding protein
VDKRQLVAAAARRSTLTRRQVDEALRVLLETVAETLAAGEPVVLRDLGRFSTWRRRQRIRGFDGQVHQVDEAQLVFKASAAMRRRLKGGP